MINCAGTFDGSGAGGQAEQSGLPNLLLPPRKLDRSVRVSGLAVRASAAYQRVNRSAYPFGGLLVSF